jgi:flagellar basal-body rod protein FlgB
MIRQLIYDNTHLPLYRNTLDAYAARHRAVASNIANASTPGYVPTRVSFETQLTEALNNRGNKHFNRPGHMSGERDYKHVRHTTWKDIDSAGENGVNGVVVEKEVTTLLTNNMHYGMVTKRASGLFTAIQSLTKMK